MKGVVLLLLTLSLALSEIADNDDVVTFTDKNADELFEEYNPVLLQFDAPVIAIQLVLRLVVWSVQEDRQGVREGGAHSR